MKMRSHFKTFRCCGSCHLRRSTSPLARGAPGIQRRRHPDYVDFKMTSKIFFTLLFLLLTSCTYRLERDARELVMHLAAEPATLNLLTYSDHYGAQVLGNIYERLIDVDAKTLTFTPKLATHWEISADGKTITFFLRENIRWHDRFPFTADDVIFTFERILDPAVDAPRLRQQYLDVEKLEKINDYTIQFHYKRPYFGAFFTAGALPVLPKHVFKAGEKFNAHENWRSPIGTGPYRFVSWEKGRSLRLVRHEEYWDHKPQIKGIVFNIIPNGTVAFQFLKKGGLDLFELSPMQWEKQSSSHSFQERFRKYHYFPPNFSFIAWNMRRPLFADKRVRQAMTMLLDRSSIIEKQLGGLGKIVTGSAYPLSKDYDTSIEPLPYNPERAIALLREAGFDDHDGDGLLDREGVVFEFTYLYPNNSNFGKKIGLLLQRQLQNVGIRMHLEQLEWATLLSRMQKRDFDALSLSWIPPLQADPFQLWHSSQADRGSNISGFRHAEVDRLLEEGRTLFDEDERAKRYQKVHRLLYEEQPVLFLFQMPTLAAVSKRFENVQAYPLGLKHREWTIESTAMLKAW